MDLWGVRATTQVISGYKLGWSHFKNDYLENTYSLKKYTSIYELYVNKTDREYQNYLKSTDWIKKELNLTQIPDRRTLNRYRKRITPKYLSNLNKLILGQMGAG